MRNGPRRPWTRRLIPLLFCAAALGPIWSAPVARGQPAPASAKTSPAAPDPGNVALAERMVDLSRIALSSPQITSAHLHVAAALLEAAAKLDPSEPRYPRLWADALLQAGDAPGAIAALKAYTAVVPDDQFALTQLVDLYAREYQTVDQRLDYLRGLVDEPRLPEPVRSHIAFLAYQAYGERGQGGQSKAMLDQALKLNPLSMEALQARLAGQTPDVATPFERITTLLAVLKSNPSQLSAVIDLAGQLSRAGLAQQALQFYSVAINLAQREGAGLSPEVAVAYATELALVNPQAAPTALPGAEQLLTNVTTSLPSNYEAVALRLMVQRAQGEKEAAAKTTQQALNVLSNQLQSLRQARGDRSATTRPVDSADPVVWGSLDEDVKAAKAAGDSAEGERARSSLVDTLAELAWFEIYFNEKPADAKPIVEAIKQLVPDESPLVARLEGWSYLMSGKADEARTKLSAVKDRDPLAAAGLIRMAGAAGKADGERLVAAHPGGLLAVQILDILHDAKVTLTPDPTATAPITEALRQFPTSWLSILDQPQNLYSLSAEVRDVATPYGAPILTTVTIKNLSEFPITIGREGVLRQDLFFDAHLRVLSGAPQDVPVAAVARLERMMVLPPHQSLTQTVRVDQGQLQAVLTKSPFPALQVLFDVRTNPTTTGVGPAGQAVHVGKFADRAPFPLTQGSLSSLQTKLQTGGPAAKLQALDLGYAVATQLVQQQGNEEAKKVAVQLLELMKGATRDASPAVQGWAEVILSRAVAPQDRATLVSRMVNDPFWATRLLGVTVLPLLPPADQKTTSEQIVAHDVDPTVVAMAKAVSQALAEQAAAAATKPSSATAPATTAPSELIPGAPLTGPTTKPAGADVVIPSLPLTLPPADGK